MFLEKQPASARSPEKAAADLTHLQEVYQKSLAALQARATAMTAEAISSKSSDEKLHGTWWTVFLSG